jgi:hypothetical protein
MVFVVMSQFRISRRTARSWAAPVAMESAFASVEPSPVVAGRPTERRARRTAATRGVGEGHRASRALVQPHDAYLPVAGAAGQFGQRHGIRDDYPSVESRVSHVTLARQNFVYHYIERSVPFD